MKIKLSFLAIAILLLAIPNISFAGNCSSPPTGFGGSWARQYKSWCESCCGTYSSSGPSCNPGSNWGCNSSRGSDRSTSTPQQPQYDYEADRQRQEQERLRQEEAERQRQRELEEQRLKEEAEAKRRQEEFEKNKQDALKSMKGIVDNELGLKGTDTSNEFGLKGIDDGKQDFGLKGIEDIDSKKDAFKDAPSGHYDPNVVDLRDKKEPLVVDPNTVKGTTAKSASKTANKPQSDNKVIEPTEADLILLFNTPEQRRQTIERIFALLNELKKSVFPKNPEPKLINPLSEPEKWAAFLEAEKKRINAEARKQAKDKTFAEIMEDPKWAKKLDEATDRINAKHDETLNAASDKYFKETTDKFEQLRKKNGMKDYAGFGKKEKEDPKFKQQLQDIVDNYWNKVQTTESREMERSLKAIHIEIIKIEKEARKE